MTTLPPDPPGIPDPVPSRPDPVALLVQAVGQLPADQRDLVLTWLLHQGLSSPGAVPGGGAAADGGVTGAVAGSAVGAAEAVGRTSVRWTGQQLRAADLQSLELLAGVPHRGGGPSAQQVVPVRFPADQHAELRDWCTAHGFSMATVIRGLVSRFLEGQQRSA